MKLVLLPLSLAAGLLLALVLCDLWQSVAGHPRVDEPTDCADEDVPVVYADPDADLLERAARAIYVEAMIDEIEKGLTQDS